jgi:hypothetical protein
MVKSPKNIADEDAIIQRRDDIGAASDKPLDAEARRALADARLRALAFALRVQQNAPAGCGETDDVELLEYLLDMLPADRRLALEEQLRGNAREFGRLMTLRSAFGSRTDRRDRQRADDPARKIPRHAVGGIDIRSVGGMLQFKDSRFPDRAQMPEPDHSASPSPFFAAKTGPRNLLQSYPSWAFPKARRHYLLEPKADAALAREFERARRSGGADLRRGLASDYGHAMMLVEEVQLLLRLHEINRATQREAGVTDDLGSDHADTIQERLESLIPELLMARDRISERFAHLLSIVDELRSAGRTESASPEEAASASLEEAAEFREFRSDEAWGVVRVPDYETWADAFDVRAGPWALHLTGTARPTPQLSVMLSSADQEVADEQPFLTLVRPKQGFESANIDSAGRATIALPRGESVLLVQHDEVWEVRLTLSNAPL